LFDDGRRICNACNERSIYDIDTIRTIMKDVASLCRDRLGLTVSKPYELQVKALNNDSSTQAKRAKEGKNGESPLFGKELGLYRLMNGKSEIFLLYGLPVEILYDTAAHEYAHAWQAENCVPNQSLEMLEGFAQRVAAQILEMKGFSKALERLEDRSDNPYGTGYHKIKALELRKNRSQLIDFVKKTQNL